MIILKLLWVFLYLNICQGREIVYRVVEEAPNGTFIGNVALDSNLMSEMSESDFRTLRYSFLSTGDSYVSLFTINQTTGNLYTARVVDREQVCPFSTICKISLETAVQSSIRSFFTKIQLSIFIEDINDNSPVFSKQTMELNIPESTLIGNSFTIYGAKDADTSADFTLSSYYLEQSNTPFNVSFVKNLDRTSIVKLVVIDQLDREVRDSYDLAVIATDGGSPARTDKLLVKVRITDVNDNAPMLRSSIYNISVKEDIPIGTVILTLNATDLDIGKNARIRYRLSPHQPKSIKSLFAIDETTGQLKTLDKLPYIEGSFYKVIIEASDMGDQPLTTQTSVQVTVIDTGNNPPQIQVNILPDPEVARISEEASVGFIIAHVVVVDTDSGLNGFVTCSVDNSHFKLQRLEVNEYKVAVAQPLDREVISNFSVTIICRDSGTSPLTSTYTFPAVVKDANDNDPSFASQLYQGSIPENNPVNSEIIQVSATDPDEGRNSVLRYQLVSSNESAMFKLRVDSITGIVTTGVSIDREITPSFSFRVLAVDSGENPRTGTTTVIVKVIDQNDVTPEFLENIFLFKISEQKMPNTTVGRLIAEDKDEGNNGKIVFRAEIGSQPFSVTTDGIIRTLQKLDRELRTSYDFAVYASDLGKPSRSSTARVNIFIADENDNRPKFIFPTISNNTVKVSEHTKPGTIIARIHASDPDEGRNGEITYALEGANFSDILYANIHTGDIIAKKGFEEHSGITYKLVAVASDRGLKPQSSRMEFSIQVSNSPSASSSTQTNITIVIVLVTVTIALSGVIILIIILIKWLDNNRKHSKEGMKVQKEFSTVNTVSKDDLDLKFSSVNRYIDSSEMEKRQKEVTFAPDIKDADDLVKLKVTNRMYGETLQQNFMKAQCEDNQSNSSMDTTNSDSGRGLSDDETHVGRGMLYHTRKGHTRTAPSPLHIQNINRDRSNNFFPEGRSPMSPIDHPPRTLYSQTSSYKFQNHVYDFDLPQTFSFEGKPRLQEQDSDQTSGIHTMEEIPTPHLNGNVV